ncbi:MAG: ribosome-binding factor A [Puniceicoccales bacterium]|nr:ribosome-binding factor A [Puniceicoccales bacterium]
MSQRTIRINQLLLREFSEELHTRWRQESVRVTFTRFDISDDLRNAVLAYTVVGGKDDVAAARQLLHRVMCPMKAAIFKRVPIKYTPEIRLVYDKSPERGASLLDVLDAVAREDAARDARHAES